MTEREAIERFRLLAFPHAAKRFDEVAAKGLKMAHYTTAESAALILKNKTMWLRNAALMNDFSEVAYGSACLVQAMAAGLGLRLETATDAAHPGLFKAITEWLNSMDAQTRQHTYLTSLSAHDPNDHLGRLSMWRAYGGPTSGVAIIFNTEIFDEDTQRFSAYSSPVLYGDAGEFANEMELFVRNIEENTELLKLVPFDVAKSILFNALQFSTLSTKHPAFQEEQEWRVIHTPLTDPSAFIPTSVQTVRGIPQMVCELPLRNQPGLHMPWMDLDRLIYQIMIGPCVYPQQVAWAFREILREAGVLDPDSKLLVAQIPLRQQG